MSDEIETKPVEIKLRLKYRKVSRGRYKSASSTGVAKHKRTKTGKTVKTPQQRVLVISNGGKRRMMWRDW